MYLFTLPHTILPYVIGGGVPRMGAIAAVTYPLMSWMVSWCNRVSVLFLNAPVWWSYKAAKRKSRSSFGIYRDISPPTVNLAVSCLDPSQIVSPYSIQIVSRRAGTQQHLTLPCTR